MAKKRLEIIMSAFLYLRKKGGQKYAGIAETELLVQGGVMGCGEA